MQQDFKTGWLKDRLFERLKLARARIGIKQSELASIGGVSAATQSSYETGSTVPTVDYLLRVKDAGLDILFVLFGQEKIQDQDNSTNQLHINWSLVREAHHAVQLFCANSAPECPEDVRWEMIQQVYKNLSTNRSSQTSHNL